MSISEGRYPPHVLREYSFLADGERGALVGPRGEVAWMCAPYWDSEAVFSSLIGGDGGYSVKPRGRFVWGGYYEPRSLIWRSRWVTEAGLVESREALAFPGTPDRLILLRQVLAVESDAQISVELEPRAGFGRLGVTGLRRDEGVWTGRTGGLYFRWQGGADARPSPERGHHVLGADITVPAGSHHDLVLEISSTPLDRDPVDAGSAWRSTEEAWKSAIPEMQQCLDPAGARMSYAVLRGLTSSSGGMVAAATTSLPERAEMGRSYDYRYVWIRDQCFAGHAAAAAGDTNLLTDAARFVTARLLADGPRMAPAYTVRGDPVPDQRGLDLPGYPGGFDRIGNWVNKQFQLDAFGEALLLLAEGARCGVLDDDGWNAARIAADTVADRWQEPDAGIWEIEDRPWTHSRLMAATGLRAMAAVTAGGHAPAGWVALADRIVADTSAHALHPDGHWMRAPDDPNVDGALLLPPLRGGLPADDPRTRATLGAFQRDLTKNGYAYRFRHGPGALGDAEGSFTLCGFVMAMALHQQGERAEALRWWERMKAACGPPMLYSEEYDVTERQMRGNIPQAFVHAVMLEADALLAGG